MMEYLLAHKAQIEILYLMSGPLIILGLFIGILQLRVIKKDNRCKYNRESIKITIDVHDEKLKLINELHIPFWESIKNEKVPAPPKITGFDYNQDIQGMTWAKNLENFKSTYNDSLRILNEIELLAQVLLSGLADEKIAFELIGAFYFDVVDGLKPYIAAHRVTGEQSDEYYKYTIKLYEYWLLKKNKTELLTTTKQIKEKIKKIKMTEKEVKTITPD